MTGAGLSREQIEARVRSLGEWFHNLDLCGVRTAPDHFLGDYPAFKWRRFAHAIPGDLCGMSVLDVGCNAGFFSIEMKRRGAARVVGIDSDPGYLAQARFAAEVSGADIELRELSVYDVARLGERFDLVLFLGVLYHLRHPLLALDRLHQHAVGDTLVFQSMARGSTATSWAARSSSRACCGGARRSRRSRRTTPSPSSGSSTAPATPGSTSWSGSTPAIPPTGGSPTAPAWRG